MKRKLIGSSAAVLVFATLILSLATTYQISHTIASPQSKAYVDPQNYIFTTDTAGIGTRFNVTVKVEDVSDIKTWQVGLFFDPTILNVTRWYEPKDDPEYVFYDMGMVLAIPAPPDVAYVPIDVHNASANVGAALFPAPPVGQGFTGDGILCIFEFEIAAVPEDGTLSCDLDIENPPGTYFIQTTSPDKVPFDTYVNGYYEISSGVVTYDATIEAYCFTEESDVSVSITMDGTPTGFNTPHTFTGLTGSHTFTVPSTDPSDHPFKEWSTGETSTTLTVSSAGTFTAYYGAPPPTETRLYVDPPEIIDPTMTPCSTFEINITIDDVEDMHVCEFNLTYNTDVLGWISINIRKVEGQMPSPEIDASDEQGYIWMRLTYPTPVTTSDPIVLVIIGFHVEAMGASPLDLHDTELLDPEDQPIPHDAEDGFFMTQIRDVAVTDVVPAQDWAYPDRQVDINVTVKNLGNVNETFDVKLYYDSNLIETQSVIDLAPEAEIILPFTWNASSVEPCNNYTITAEATTVPFELNTTNNIYVDGSIKVYFLGDINRDGEVDMADISVIIDAFGSYSHPVQHPDWNPDADLNQDGMIDMVDVSLLIKNFGRSCSL